MNDENDKTESPDPFQTDTTIPLDVLSADFERSATLVGQVLDGRFLIEKDLTDTGADKGGIGLVYLARDTKMMDRKVVVKILQKAALENAEIIRKFQHEKEALIRLNHPNIVSILDSGTLTDGNPFMVMEYIPGYSLRKLLRENGRLPFDLSAHIIESVGNALGAAHSQKILHRDLKPENIMLTPQEGGFDQVKLIDFGIARVEESQLAPETSVGTGSGTLKYMAPEQITGQLKQGPAIDVYALASVVYEMLTGAMPFPIKSKTLTEAVIERHEQQKNGVQVDPRSLCPGLSDLSAEKLLSGLEYDPAKRPQDARQFARGLAASLNQGLAPSADNAFDLNTAPTELVNDISVITRDKHEADQGEVFTAPSRFDIAPTPRPKSTRSLLWAALAFIVLAALAIPAGIAYWNSGGAGPTTSAENKQPAAVTNDPAALERKISYFLNVQKMRNGKPFEEPFKSSGQEVFESGYKFKLAFEPDAAGYMYLFNEGKDSTGKTGYYLLFPTPNFNNGSPQVTAGQQIETSQNTFSGGVGTETMWIIWSKEKRDDLDAITNAVQIPPGSVQYKDTATLQSFLDKYKVDKATATKDSTNQRTVIKAKGDVVVHRFELEHR